MSSCSCRKQTKREVTFPQPTLPRPRWSGLEVEATAADEDFAGYVIGKRRAEEENCACRLGRRAQATQRTRGLHRFQHFGLHSDPDRMPAHFDAGFLARENLSKARLNQPETNRVYVDVIAAPLLSQGSR